MDDNARLASVRMRKIEAFLILIAAGACWYLVAQSNWGAAAFAALVALAIAIELGASVIAMEIAECAGALNRTRQ